MAATTKLIVYNDTLREIGGHPLADLVTANTSLQTLEGAFPHAVEYLLGRVDWNFARRRATLTGVSDTSFSPYTYRYARPSDYLRKLWLKTAATDEFQINHAESGAVIYGFEATALLEYISDHSDNYDPVNWPPHFTRCVVLYLALLVAPKLARVGQDDAAASYQKLDIALADAERAEAVFNSSEQIPADRLQILRRAMEIMGQVYTGSMPLHAQADQLRYQMNRAWGDALSFVLEQAAWNFATKRALLTTGADAGDVMPGEEVGGIIEGYSVEGGPGNGESPFDQYAFAGFKFAWYLPDDFRHKIWLKNSASHDTEIDYQIIRDAIFTNRDPCVLEYIAEDEWTTDPDNWPYTFRETMAARLAFMVVPDLLIEQDSKGRGRIKADGLRDKLETYYLRSLGDAKIKDAIQQAVKTIPLGRFARARQGSIGATSLRRWS